jgi:catechol 2,3-dioxygenase-like lactoylglutathione lyase family enzyme
MIHVPDVRAAVEWYERIGFRVLETFGNGAGGLSFGILIFGDSRVMFNQGGQSSAAARREVDLYVYTDDLEQHYARLRELVPIAEELRDTDYGMREFVLRDLNGFWITFGRDL